MKVYLAALFLFLIAFATIGHDVNASEWLHQALLSVDPWLQRVTWVGDGRVLIPFCLAWALYLYTRGHRDLRRDFLAPLSTFVAWAASGLLVQLLKFVFGRPRPYLGRDPRYPNIDLGLLHWFKVDFDFASFPSGHSTAVFAVAWCVVLHTKKKWVKVAIMSVAVLVALTRVALAKHFFADTLAGAAIGTAFAQASLNYKRFAEKTGAPRKS